MKKNRLFIFALTAMLAVGFAGCGGTTNTSTPESVVGSEQTSEQTSVGSSEQTSVNSSTPDPEPTYGLPTATIGHYIKDADILDDCETRILLYTTNEESGEEDNVIATRTATFVEEKGWLYGDESIALVGGAEAWDEYIGSASIVKGEFEYGDVEYTYLMAYAATSKANDTQYEIGLAVAEEIGGTWVKVGEKALIEYDENVYGTSMVGYYAPSLVSLNKESIVRLYFTYADAYGHFTQFVDINAADLDAVYSEAAKNDYTLISGTNQLPTNGNFSGGDAALMFPNADLAHDCTNGKVYAVKDYSPSAALAPAYAEKIELGVIAEAELYTAEVLNGWASIKLWDMMDTPDALWERLYSATIVTDAYGHVDGATEFEIIYNVCEIAMDNADWMFTQNLLSFNITLGE